jgi:hypothetical protein
LIASGTQSYLPPYEQLEQVPDELRLITELFREYGFEETLTDLRLNPTAQEFRVALEDWLTDESRDPEEVGAPTADTAFMGLTSSRWITIAKTLARRRRVAQPASCRLPCRCRTRRRALHPHL